MSVIIWWLSITLIGLAVFPSVSTLFIRFEDRGIIFSKMIGLLFISGIHFALNTMHLLPFTQAGCLITAAVVCAVNIVLFYKGKLAKNFKGINISLIAAEEAVLLFLYIIWVWIIGYRPGAYGTEKFMDYGFVTSMLKSQWMPFEDMWYAGEPINYYYGGQYVTAWIAKLCGVSAGIAYTTMRATIAAFSFSLPLALVYQMLRERFKESVRIPWTGGVLAGLACGFCGNFHYVIYGIILEAANRIKGVEYSYWFPDSTRYIGYDPDLPDKTIHEYPAYSTILGDLHAHYINILFVVTVTAIAYAFAQRILAEGREPEDKEWTAKSLAKEIFLQPELILIGLMTGYFRFTNFWDFPIYFVVCGSVVFFMNLWKYGRSIRRFAAVMAGQAVFAFLLGVIAALPFTLTFDQISTEVGLVHSHTQFYQFMILWGLPLAVSILFIAVLVREQRTKLLLARNAIRLTGRREAAEKEKADPPESGEETADMEEINAVLADLQGTDSRYMDSERADTEYMGSERSDAGYMDPERADTGYMDSERSDAGYMDPERSDAVFTDLQKADTEFADPEKTGAGFTDLQRADAASPDLQKADIGSAGPERADAGLTDSDPGGAERRSDPHEKRESEQKKDQNTEGTVLLGLRLPDLAALLFALCAIGLILMPEVIYVKDIYGGEHYRANTMFKLTYQAWILFAIVMGYALIRILAGRMKFACVLASVCTVLLLLTLGYLPRSIMDWFGNIFDPSLRIGTDASVFVDESFHTDYAAITWLNNEVKGRPVCLEAPGDSYSTRERVSVATGLPTVAGWYVHEWLWRGDPDAVSERNKDIEAIYTSGDEKLVKSLIEKYNITYIYIGTQERQAYYNSIKDVFLQGLGEVVFSDGEYTYIVKIGQTDT